MKKSLLFLCLGLSSMLVFAGCNKEDPVVEEPVVESVVEEPAEAVETVETEEVVEEPAEEVGKTVVEYTAEDVEKHIEEIAPSFGFLTKDQLDALVIAVNLDHISEEELEAIMAENNYTVESLNESYINSLKYYNMLYVNMQNYTHGVGQYDESLADLYDEIDFSTLNMSEEYAELYEDLEHNYCEVFKSGFEFNYPEEQLNYSTSEEKVIFDIMWIMDTEEIDYDSELKNPYLDLLN